MENFHNVKGVVRYLKKFVLVKTIFAKMIPWTLLYYL